MSTTTTATTRIRLLVAVRAPQCDDVLIATTHTDTRTLNFNVGRPPLTPNFNLEHRRVLLNFNMGRACLSILGLTIATRPVAVVLDLLLNMVLLPPQAIVVETG